MTQRAIFFRRSFPLLPFLPSPVFLPGTATLIDEFHINLIEHKEKVACIPKSQQFQHGVEKKEKTRGGKKKSPRRGLAIGIKCV